MKRGEKIMSKRYLPKVQSNDSKVFLPIDEVAGIFGITSQTVYGWIKNKGLKWCKLSARKTRIRPKDLYEYFREQKDLKRTKELDDYLRPDAIRSGVFAYILNERKEQEEKESKYNPDYRSNPFRQFESTQAN